MRDEPKERLHRFMLQSVCLERPENALDVLKKARVVFYHSLRLMPGSWWFLIACVLYTKYAVRHFNLIQITEWMQIRQNVTPIRIKYNILPRPLRPDTIMNKYKRYNYE